MKILGFSTMALVLMVLAGCSGKPAAYSVKQYNGGGDPKTFDATSYSTSDNRVYAYTANGRENLISGSFSVRRTDAGAANSTVRATQYHAELYSGGKVVETQDAYDYSCGSLVTLYVNNTENVYWGGTVVLKNIGVKADGTPDSAKFRVTAYSDGVVIGTWNVDSYSTDGNYIDLTFNGISHAVIIGGSYLIEQFR